jgi:hypothetical protein
MVNTMETSAVPAIVGCRLSLPHVFIRTCPLGGFDMCRLRSRSSFPADVFAHDEIPEGNRSHDCLA